MPKNSVSKPIVTVGALVVGPSARVLLTQTYKWRHRWSVPGGKIEDGETMVAALLREFREETALDLYDVRWAPTQESVYSDEFYRDSHMILLNFIARSEQETVTLNDEADRYAWVTPPAALDYDLNSVTRPLVEFYLAHGHSTELVSG
ncbi:MAG: NUDIX domain-containing protein [Trueperaceae bacterium]|nr:NUDIX domain-containing protein [Trueperaceae bacterium]